MRILDESKIEKTFVERAPLLQGGDGWDDRPEEKADPNGTPPHPDAPRANGHPLPQAAKSMPEAHPSRPVAGKTRLGSGLVKDTIGSGGMASVYLVWNERLELFRAVKMLSLDALHDRFETEIKISAKLRHPNIVEIYGVGEWNGLPYMEMEYIDGENLQQILTARGRFPEAVCCAAGICMAGALHYAHNLKFTLGGNSFCGIIHRDLKPANIMFSKDGAVKLTDFGIARPAQASLHTAAGNIVGTLHYLSPEQMEGRNVDHRSDIYSFGTLLYEMATGARTFPQESITELMKQRTTNSFKKPAEYDFPVNSALADIILRCLKPAPKDRYQSAQGLLDDLRKAYAALTDAAPERVLSSFYPKSEADVAYARIITEKPGLLRVPQRKSVPRRALLFISLALMAILSISYMSVRFFSSMAYAQKQGHNPPPAVVRVDEGNTAPVPIVDTPPAAAPEQKAAPNIIPEPAAAAESKPVNEPKTAPAPKPTPEPAKAASEDDLIRSATAALNRQDWDQAIRILEKPGAYKDKGDHRALLLLEACVESKRLDRAQALLDSAARTGDAHYFLSAGKYWFYRKNHAKSIEMLEASMSRPSASRNKNLISDDAMYYIAMVRSERFKAVPSNANRLAALDGWRGVQSAYGSRPGNPRLERAEREIAALN